MAIRAFLIEVVTSYRVRNGQNAERRKCSSRRDERRAPSAARPPPSDLYDSAHNKPKHRHKTNMTQHNLVKRCKWPRCISKGFVSKAKCSRGHFPICFKHMQAACWGKPLRWYTLGPSGWNLVKWLMFATFSVLFPLAMWLWGIGQRYGTFNTCSTDW